MKHAGTINHGKVPSSTNSSASAVPAADYRLLFESVPAPCLVLDLEFRIVAVNDAYLRATMTKREEILGRSIFEVFPDNPAEPDATGVCNLSASLKRVLQNKAADTTAVQKYDIRKPEEKGGGFEERYWSPINTPVFAAGGEITYIIHRVEDVTEFVHLKQKGVEEHKFTEELREHAVQMEAEIYARAQEIQRLASFPLMNPNPVLELDANGQMTFCNPAAKQILENAGYSTVTNPLLPQDISVILQSLRDKKTGQFFREIEINGSFFEELIYIAPQFQSVRIYTMDITERKQSEDEIKKLNAILSVRATELEDANRELEAFNYTAAHDLRQPLNIISSYCQVINELCGDKLDEKCKEYLQETYGGTMRMNRLIEALLDFSRMAHAELNRTGVDLGSIAKEVAEELKGTGGARRVEIRIADGLDANGDARLLRVVLANLLGNAWKYTAMRAEAVIEFAATEIDGQPVYFVSDNGSGFDMAYADKLFAPFQRLPGAEECRGFGIGLATVERIIRRHGGRIWAEGEPGKAATFYFTLPQ